MKCWFVCFCTSGKKFQFPSNYKKSFYIFLNRQNVTIPNPKFWLDPLDWPGRWIGWSRGVAFVVESTTASQYTKMFFTLNTNKMI